MRSAGCWPRPGFPAPRHGTATSPAEALQVAAEIGYPVLVRPSYVLGGRGMEIVPDAEELAAALGRLQAAGAFANPAHPVLVDNFLDDAVEIDVDALYDGTELFLGGIMEHIEEAGVHSGDSACALPPITLGIEELARIRSSTEAIASGVGVRGLLNVQYALVARHALRARGEPPGVPDRAVRVEGDRRAAGEGVRADHARRRRSPSCAPRACCRRPATAARCRPARRCRSRRRSCRSAGSARSTARPSTRCSARRCDRPARSWASTSCSARRSPRRPPPRTAGCPTSGKVFVSVANRDKRHMVFPVKRLADLGFTILATAGTAEVLRRNGVPAEVVRKHSAGPGPDGEPTIVGMILRRRRRAGREHAVRHHVERAAAARRLRDPDGVGPPVRAVHHDGPGPRRGGAGHRGADPRRDHRAQPAGPPRGAARIAGRRPGRSRERTGPGRRRGGHGPPGRRVPPPRPARADHRRATSGPATSSRWRSAASTRACCCAGRSASTAPTSAARRRHCRDRARGARPRHGLARRAPAW